MLRLKVSGMTCEGCANAVKRAVGGVAKGATVDVDLPKGEVTVDGPADAATVIAAIDSAGFTVERELR